MAETKVDIFIAGDGLAGATVARVIAQQTPASIVLVPGAGKSRSVAIDGGIIDPRALERVFGPVDDAPIHRVGDRYVFRRDHLEAWARGHLGPQVRYVTDFEETLLRPHDSGDYTIVPATGDDAYRAALVVLTEGANPKIGIAARVREDFSPDDMVHVGRTFLTGVDLDQPAFGSWRTSWGMPAWYLLIPFPHQYVLVSVSARMTNVIRSAHDARDALRDFLASPTLADLGISGDHGEIGMELVPLRAEAGLGSFGRDKVVISADASGAIDARDLDRFTLGVNLAAEFAAMMVAEWPNIMEYDDVGESLLRVFRTERTPYHDDKTTGFIEDGRGAPVNPVARFLNRFRS